MTQQQQQTKGTKMKAHELAALLMTLPDFPVMINGWGSEEGLGPFEVDAYFIRQETGKPDTIELWD